MTLEGQCKNYTQAGSEIVFPDGVVFYQLNPSLTFGIQSFSGSDDYSAVNECKNSGGSEFECESKREYTFYPNGRYFWGAPNVGKMFCIDVDGIPTTGSADCDDEKDICPFGYAIRADGKIIIGQRAIEWLEKSIQNEN